MCRVPGPQACIHFSFNYPTRPFSTHTAQQPSSPQTASVLATLPAYLLNRESQDTLAFTHFSFSCPVKALKVQKGSGYSRQNQLQLHYPAKVPYTYRSWGTPTCTHLGLALLPGHPQHGDHRSHTDLCPLIFSCPSRVPTAWRVPGLPAYTRHRSSYHQKSPIIVVYIGNIIHSTVLSNLGE